MAADTVPPREQAPSSPRSYTDYANHLSYQLYELAYQAQAVRALLHEYPKSDEIEELTGVSYLLTRLQEDCKKLSDDVCETTRTYALNPAADHA